MEVHHHSLHGKKKWTEYFWEFFMLFLAVTLGFFVENQREHLIEHKREKQYMLTLLEDLRKDIAELEHDTAFWKRQVASINTIRNQIIKPEGERNKLLLYKYASYMRWYQKFVYHDRTIAQLKNGGNFRLIRNSGVADSLIEYDAHVITNLRDMEILSNDLWQQLNYLVNKIFNSAYHEDPRVSFNIDSAAKIDSKPIEMRKGTDNELFEFYNILGYFKGLNMIRNYEHDILLTKANNLVELIKKEYHIK